MFCNCFPRAQIGVRSGVVMQEGDLIHLPVWSTIPVHCFNFVNVCTYLSELIVAPLSKKSSKKKPLLSLNSLPWLFGRGGASEVSFSPPLKRCTQRLSEHP